MTNIEERVGARVGREFSGGFGGLNATLLRANHGIATEIAWIRLSGEVDLSSAETLLAVFDYAEQIGARFIMLDMSRVAFIDLVGVSYLLAAHRRFESRGGRLSIYHMPRSGSRVAQVTGLDNVLHLHYAQPTDHPGDQLSLDRPPIRSSTAASTTTCADGELLRSLPPSLLRMRCCVVPATGPPPADPRCWRGGRPACSRDSAPLPGRRGPAPCYGRASGDFATKGGAEPR